MITLWCLCNDVDNVRKTSLPAGPGPTEFGVQRVGVIEGLIMLHDLKTSAVVLGSLPVCKFPLAGGKGPQVLGSLQP